MMKKILSIILISVMLISVFAINAGAETEFTKEEALKLFDEAYEKIHVIYNIYPDGFIFNSERVFDWIDTLGSEKQGHDIVFKKPGSDEYAYAKYYVVKDERFKTMDDCYAYAKETFVDSIATSLIDRNPHKTSDPLPSFRTIGTDYKIEGKIEGQPETFPADTLVHFSWNGGFYTQLPEGINSFGEFKAEDDKATLNVIYEKFNWVETVKYPLTVEFSKTEKGWRVSGGTFIGYLMGTYSLSNPGTSDQTPIYLTAIALITLAAPLVVKRRREA